NGKIGPLEDASIRVDDRGFMLADGIYEVIRVYQGQPFMLDRHLHRLQRSASLLDLQLDPGPAEIERVCREMVALQGAEEATIYLQVTRGAAPRAHAIPPELKPTTVLMVSPFPTPDPARRLGVAAITVPDDRWARCEIKTIGLTANVLAKERAVRAGAFEAIFVRDGYVTDGASSNVFAVLGGALLTPPRSNYILAGITRDLVLELAERASLRVLQQVFGMEDLRRAEEIMLTSTTSEVLPVIQLDAAAVGNGERGPICLRLQNLFDDLIRRSVD
ncbi:MAG: aminotransferase class IV, partial [Chloroflexota bacterium]|nr:aminotransferase class IV [Chloroflexota bacterium]